ncbi:MAG: hypothetical protein EA398_16015 [Deltaproteobacteria bacterium]|nr:MAG: hypothetical protein EA398_16015 [Deltaproteobacteria bacterium]
MAQATEADPAPGRTATPGATDAQRRAPVTVYGGPPDRDLLDEPSRASWTATLDTVSVEVPSGAEPPRTAEVQRILRRANARLEQALVQASERHGAEGSGVLAVTVQVDASGRVRRVEARASGFADSAFVADAQRSAEAALRGLRFRPTPDNVAYTVEAQYRISGRPPQAERAPAPTPGRTPDRRPPDATPPPDRTEPPDHMIRPVPVYGGAPDRRR